MRTVIIDGTWLGRMNYHAMPHLTNSIGDPTGAVHGYVGSLIKILRQYKPDYIMACFDRYDSTLFRKQLYPEYKADHKPQDNDLHVQWPMIREANEAFCVEHYEARNFEADDLIGTLSMMAEVKGHDVLIYAYDADMFQLVTDKCHVVTPKEEVTPATVKSRYGIDPRQITDYKALIGDPSDNIPRFIGEKTASALLCEFGTIDGIYQALSPSFDSPVLNIRPNIISILNENERAIRLNLKLTTIVRNIPIMFSQTSHYLNDERVYAFLKKMEFQQLQGRYAKWRMFDK